MVISMDRWRGKLAVVTGASEGIGAAISQVLVKEGVNVVGLARNLEKLKQLEKSLENYAGKFTPLQSDITKDGETLSAFEWIKQNLGPAYILINNAGVVRNAPLLDGSIEEWRRTFDTNVLGLCVATREAIKSMRENNVDGHVVHINSIVGHKVPEISAGVYPASKHAVTALTETLRQELNGINSKIRITEISPGAVDTQIIASGGHTTLKDMFAAIPKLRPEDVADAVIYALSTPQDVLIYSLQIKPMGERF